MANVIRCRCAECATTQNRQQIGWRKQKDSWSVHHSLHIRLFQQKCERTKSNGKQKQILWRAIRAIIIVAASFTQTADSRRAMDVGTRPKKKKKSRKNWNGYGDRYARRAFVNLNFLMRHEFLISISQIVCRHINTSTQVSVNREKKKRWKDTTGTSNTIRLPFIIHSQLTHNKGTTRWFALMHSPHLNIQIQHFSRSLLCLRKIIRSSWKIIVSKQSVSSSSNVILSVVATITRSQSLSLLFLCIPQK